MNSTIGHHHQRQQLANLVRINKLPSALLLTGVKGIGKSRIAREIAQQLLCETGTDSETHGCGTCRCCTLFHVGNHPDLHSLSFGGESGASVDDVRDTLERMSLRAFMGRNKVAIFDDADELSVVGANIILKSLEEPRPNTFFILIASNPSRLPSTILSRCQRIFFDQLSTEEIKAIMAQRGIPEADEALLILADGSASALDALQAQREMWEDTRHVVDKAWLGDGGAIAKAAQEWGAEKSLLRERLTLLRATIRQKLLATAGDIHAASVWSVALQNVLDGEYLLFDRHVNPTLVIVKILQSCDQKLASSYLLIPRSTPTLGEALIG